MLTFGAKGFVLESAMTDDDDGDDEMRVARGERNWAEGVPHVARAPNLGLPRTGHRTLPLTHTQPQPSRVPVPFIHLVYAVMASSSIMARFLLCLSSLFLFFHFVSSHLVEVPASKKECFFEDLHVNDQVHLDSPRLSNCLTLIVTDDRHVPGWWRRPLGHRFLGEIRTILVCSPPLTLATDQRSYGRRN
jgi:hypothetical protein